MRIALYHDLPSGGAKRTVREQVIGLRARGHVVDAFVPATADEQFLPLAGVADELHVFAGAAPPGREKLLAGSAGLRDYARWAWFLARLPRRERAYAARIDAGAYDVVLVHPSQFTQAPSLLRTLRTRSLYYCHELLRGAYDARIAPAHVRFAVRMTVGRIDRAAVRAASAVAANSAFTAALLRRVHGVDPHIVHPGVDVSAFAPRQIARGDYVLSVGALHPLKGHDFLIDALSAVPAAERPPLVVVSDRVRERERSRLERRAAAGSVDLRIRSRVSEAELAQIYAEARLILYAPHDEPFGLVPLEAMASGTAVLAVPEGGVVETVIEGVTGFLAPRDPRIFGLRIQALLADPETERVAADAATRVRAQWSWTASIDKLETLLTATAGK